MIAEARSYSFRLRSRLRRRRVCLTELPIREFNMDMTTATSWITPLINDLIGWMKKNNRAARAACFLV